MSLFQHSVLNKYLQGIDEKVVNVAWEKFTAYFHNLERQENIRNIKEEEYGIDFLIKFFVNILGYTKNPDPIFNLKAEQKNLTDSKKADGAILQDEKVIGVIELKGMDTTDLGGKVEGQAFGYKNHQPEAVYVITSNFEKLRFYIDNAVDFEEFNLFQLTQEQFKILWLCLAKENVFRGIPKKIKDESLEEEELITKKLYKDYSTFKHEIFNSIVELNPQYDKLLLFKKTQKLLDRFLFIFFAEDRLLLPPNSIRNIIKQWRELKENYDEHFPLYDRFKKYFEYMNTGFKGKEHTIFAYNGGLFKSDIILDEIKIDDEVLYHHSLKLSHYDFESEVSVNILGHIFEHSLNEIEEITAELEGKEVDKSKTKRKKDGVYYTPKYITKYIVENTVGKLCEEKKTELGIFDEEYEKERKGRRKTTLKTLQNKLEKYRKWLLEITICDPACGSGAFLIQALDFLINEHRYIDELNRKLLGHSIVYRNVEKSILENNLYGVDINDEAVEIAKLSLWLRTAHKGRKLTTLSNNIKCGNSLIDDIEIAGEKAFNWESEFSEIFKKGGFDVIIGNPPYVDNRGFDKIVLKYLFKNYPHSFQKSGTDSYKTTKLNLIAPFIELNQKILKMDGLLSYIFHKNIFKTNGYTSIRHNILSNYNILKLTDWGAGQFRDVVAETATFVLQKGKIKSDSIIVEFYNLSTKTKENIQSQKVFLKSYEYIFGIYADAIDRKLLEKVENDSNKLGDYVNINNGIVTGNDKKYISKEKVDKSYKKATRGKDIKRYAKLNELEYVLYESNLLLRSRNEEIFKAKEKLLMQMINIEFVITYDDKQFYNLGTTYAITLKNTNLSLKYLLSILNSKLTGFYYKKKFTNDSSLTNAISTQNLVTIPIKAINYKNQIPFVELSDKMLTINISFQDLKTKFIERLKDNFNLEKVSKKLNEFYLYDFGSVINELKKQKITFKLREQDEWSSYFEENKAKINQLQAEIDKTDREIDLMVYKLYGLTEREIMIVEGKV